MEKCKQLLWLVLIMMFVGLNLPAKENDGDRKGKNEMFQDDMDDDMDMEDEMDDEDDHDDDDDEKEWEEPKTLKQLWKIVFGELEELNQEETLRFYKNNICQTIEEEAAKILKKDPEGAVDFFMETFEEYAEVKEEQNENPEMFDLWLDMTKQEATVYMLVEKINRLKRNKTETDSAQKSITADTAKLKKALGMLFELRIKSEKMELKNLEEEVKEFKEHIKKRQANKEKIVQKRMEKLLGEEDEFAW